MYWLILLIVICWIIFLDYLYLYVLKMLYKSMWNVYLFYFEKFLILIVIKY